MSRKLPKLPPPKRAYSLTLPIRSREEHIDLEDNITPETDSLFSSPQLHHSHSWNVRPQAENGIETLPYIEIPSPQTRNDQVSPDKDKKEPEARTRKLNRLQPIRLMEEEDIPDDEQPTMLEKLEAEYRNKLKFRIPEDLAEARSSYVQSLIVRPAEPKNTFRDKIRHFWNRKIMKRPDPNEKDSYTNLTLTQLKYIRDLATGNLEVDGKLKKKKRKLHLAVRARRYTKENKENWFKEFGRNVRTLLFTWKPITPDCPFKVVWDLVALVFSLYELAIYPVERGFYIDITALNVVNMIVIIFFLLDILLFFRTGYFSDGLLVMDNKKIAKHYLRTYFVVDLLATFPFVWIFGETRDLEDDHDENVDGFFRFLIFWNVFVLLRVFRLARNFHKLENYVDFSDYTLRFITFLKVTILVLYTTHWCACYFFFLGYTGYLVHNYSWITVNGLVDESASTQWLNSYYWAVTTMITVGYGDITPVTNTEKSFTVFYMITVPAVIGYGISQAGGIITGYSAMPAAHREAIQNMVLFMRKRGVRKDIEVRIKEYLEYTFSQEVLAKSNEDTIKHVLSDSLREKLIHEIYGRALISDELLSNIFVVEFLYKVAHRIQEHNYSPEDTIKLESDKEKIGLYFKFRVS